MPLHSRISYVMKPIQRINLLAWGEISPDVSTMTAINSYLSNRKLYLTSLHPSAFRATKPNKLANVIKLLLAKHSLRVMFQIRVMLPRNAKTVMFVATLSTRQSVPDGNKYRSKLQTYIHTRNKVRALDFVNFKISLIELLCVGLV